MPQPRLSLLVSLATGLLLWVVQPAAAQSSDSQSPDALRAEIARLQQQIDTLTRTYDERLAALEQRLAALGSTPPGPTPPDAQAPAAQAPAAIPPQAQAPEANPPQQPAQPTPPGPPDTTLTGTGPVPSGKVFNPDIAVIGNMLGAAGTNDVEPSPALQLDEAEASFQAILDPYARGDFFFSFGPDGVDVEEGFITFNTLPGGLLLKAGKLRAAFGKVNTMHTHALPWADRPLVTRTLVGADEGLSDAGLSVSKLVLNPLFYLEATGEVFRGQSDVFNGTTRSDLTYVGRLRGYRDLTEGTNLDLGTSIAWGHTEVTPDATKRLIGVDATFRYRPLRRAIYKRFIARSELVWSQDRLDGSSPTAFGMYASGEYQFARRWFAGGRYDYSERPLTTSLADKGGAAILTFWPSEFSQIRGQYRRTRYAEGTTANEVLFQFLFSIGAHGAHVF
jgi:hypothetical protein